PTADNYAPLRVNTLELSALGANADIFGSWAYSATANANILLWSDLGQGGRTVRSVVTKRGYLFPLGHHAAITTTVNRVVVEDPPNASSDPNKNYAVAYLQAQTVIHVAEPVKTYPAPGQLFGDTTSGGTTDWPFVTVRMVTLASPPIYTQSSEPQFLWPLTTDPAGNNVDVTWNFVATDLAGHDVPFSMPLAFVYADDGSSGYFSEYDPTKTMNWVNAYMTLAGENTPSHDTWSATGGSRLKFAPELAGPGGGPGATTHPTLGIVLGASNTTYDPVATNSQLPASLTPTELGNLGQPNFYPTIKAARIKLHAAEVLTGNGFADVAKTPDPLYYAGGIQGVLFGYYPNYVQYSNLTYGSALPHDAPRDIPQNLGSAYVQALNPPQLTLPGSSVGGLATPNLGVTGLSAAAGTIGGDLDTFAQDGAAQLESYFPTVAGIASGDIAQLLGGLQLGNILAGAGAAAGSVAHDSTSLFNTPVISSQLDQSTGVLTVTYTLNTPLAGWPAPGSSGSPPGIFVPDDADGTLQMTAVVMVGSNGQPPTYTVNGTIDPFTIFLLGCGNDPYNSSTDFISLHFESCTFSAATGSSPAVSVNLDTVLFDGPLSFINVLQQFLESLGGNGLSIDVEATFIQVSMSISLPDQSCGVFSLTGISFSAGVLLPFTNGQATLTFAFASKANPFTLTIAMFGGGGYISLVLGFGGVQSMSMEFFFTGQFAFNIAIVSGSLSLTAGIYLSYSAATLLELNGYVQIMGQLQAFGFITISAELDLTLSWAEKTGNLVGTATFIGQVSICGFSKTVEFSISKQFAGSSASGGANQAVTRGSGLGGHELTSHDAGPPVTFSALMSNGDWDTYCAAFSA
ncbi:MAG: hypothetical protein ACLPQS_03315, partial [Acidimicrobiales bacterium]